MLKAVFLKKRPESITILEAKVFPRILWQLKKAEMIQMIEKKRVLDTQDQPPVFHAVVGFDNLALVC